MASALIRRRFTLEDLDAQALNDGQVHALADKVDYAIDPNSAYPRYFSGELVLRLKDGREFAHREGINRGSPDRPLTEEELLRKFADNAQRVTSPRRASAIADAVLAIDQPEGLADFERLLAKEGEP